MTPDLSIVIATCNRAALLRQAIESVRAETHCQFELIVVDGASGDETPVVLKEAQERLGDRLRIIRETQREGFVRAANKGFRAARGRNLMWLNDDARALPGALDLAVEQMDQAPASVGLLALFHHCDVEKNIAYQTWRLGVPFKLLHVRGTLYANFGMGRRTLFEQLGFFDERYFLNAADPDFSLKVWHAGLRVMPAFGSLIDHDEHEDARRATDSPRAIQDNETLFRKWDLPEKNPAGNDFVPARSCTLRGLRP